MKKLPFDINFNTVEILLELNNANNKIGELKGILKTLENPNIILNAILLVEAKDSSEIENIITTFDELYKEINTDMSFGQAKEVLNYIGALRVGIELLDNHGFISVNHIKQIHNCVEGSIRNTLSTVIKNTKTNETIYTPQSKQEIEVYLDNLEIYLNSKNEYDPLINMGLIHYQFKKYILF